MSLQRQVLADSPAGFWPLDEPSGAIAYDVSGAGRNGTPTGTTAHAGHLGMRAYDFDGTDQVSIAHNAALQPTTFTLEWWFYLDTQVSNAGLGKNLAYRVDMGSDGAYFYIMQSSGVYWRYARLGWASIAGSVNHVVASFDAGTNAFSFVWNGVDTAPAATGGPQGSRNTGDSNALLLGKYPLFNTIDGRMWGCAIYNTVLPVARAKAHYRAGLRSGVVGP